MQLKRRADLIPSLVQIVKTYSQHERTTLEEVARLRIAVNSVSQKYAQPSEREQAERVIATDVKKIIALAESYPNLKADENYLEFQSTLTVIEEDLQASSRYYNGCVREINTLVQSFPANLFASSFGMENREFFELELIGERIVPEVDIDLD